MMPLKVLLEPEVGASVRVAVLLAVVLVTVPLPVSEPSVGEMLSRSRTAPLLIDTVDELPRAVAAAVWMVPVLMVVGPV